MVTTEAPEMDAAGNRRQRASFGSMRQPSDRARGTRPRIAYSELRVASPSCIAAGSEGRATAGDRACVRTKRQSADCPQAHPPGTVRRSHHRVPGRRPRR